mmetsp:Transcript_74152/g.211678  ORF Transcript_74152/g.211678 Transcript_74152/m.211678 type:complete len:349 (-) Transcript_74152:140-1186(-)
MAETRPVGRRGGTEGQERARARATQLQYVTGGGGGGDPAVAAVGQEPPPSKMYVMRGLLMLFGTMPMGVAHWSSLALDDRRLYWVGEALCPLSVLLLICHYFVTMQLTEDVGRLEMLHQAGYWCMHPLPGLVRGFTAGFTDPIVPVMSLFMTYPVYAIVSRIRKAVRAHQLRSGSLGSYVDDLFAQVMTIDGIPMLYFTMESMSVWLRLESWPLGSEPGADLDDEDEVELAKEASNVALSIYSADFTFNLLLVMLAVSQLALFGTGLSNVRALMAFRVPGYQRVAGTALIVMGVIALYFQASKGYGLTYEEGLAAIIVFCLALLVFVVSLGYGLPLKRVLNGGRIAPV